MIKVGQTLLALMGKARVLRRMVIPIFGNEQCQVWKLSDGNSLVINAKTIHKSDGVSFAKFENIKKVDSPYHRVVQQTKRSARNARKRHERGEELCF